MLSTYSQEIFKTSCSSDYSWDKRSFFYRDFCSYQISMSYNFKVWIILLLNKYYFLSCGIFCGSLTYLVLLQGTHIFSSLGGLPTQKTPRPCLQRTATCAHRSSLSPVIKSFRVCVSWLCLLSFILSLEQLEQSKKCPSDIHSFKPWTTYMWKSQQWLN